MRAAGSTHLLSLAVRARLERDKKITMMVAIMVSTHGPARLGFAFRSDVSDFNSPNVSDNLLLSYLAAVRLHLPGRDSRVMSGRQRRHSTLIFQI